MATYNIHGIHVRVETAWGDLAQLISSNLANFPSGSVGTSSSLEVSITRRKKNWLSTTGASWPKLEAGEKWGTGIRLEGNTVWFDTGPLRIRLTVGSPTRVEATYLVDRRTRLAGIRRRAPSWEVCQRVMRLALYQPLFYLFEKRGWSLFHAAAVELDGQAVMLTGLNGSGKSTLCHTLLGHANYMSDNISFWDGEDVLGFPEAMRIHRGQAPPQRERDAPVVYGKVLRQIKLSKVVHRSPPGAIVFLTLAGNTALSSVPADDLESRLTAIHDVTHEFPRHSYLGVLPRPKPNAPLSALAHQAKALTLRIGSFEEAQKLLLRAVKSDRPV